jgi:4-amino-4-deoxy-L-arabinose transferase-like glycosyltransferase
LLLLIVALAILLRLAPGLIHPFLFDDSRDYQTLASNLLTQHIYQIDPDHRATRMPGYPILLAFTGNSVPIIMILQSLCGGAIVWIVYLLGRRISRPVALLAAALAALDPVSIAFSASLLSETPFTLLLMFALWQSLRLINRPTLPRWLALGLLWGVAVYFRVSALWCIVPLGLFVWVQSKNRKLKIENSKNGSPFSISNFLFSILVVFLLLLPWQIRNFNLFHTNFFRLTTLEGISLYEAVYPAADGSPKQDLLLNNPPPDMKSLGEAELNDEYSHRARHYIRTDPLRILSLAVKKIARTWSPFMNAANFQNPALQAALALWHIPLFIFALFAAFFSPLPLKIKGTLLIPILYFTALHALFLGSVRYRVPLMPIVCLFGAAGITTLIEKCRNSQPATPSTV